jgi:hypothetical protein
MGGQGGGEGHSFSTTSNKPEKRLSRSPFPVPYADVGFVKKIIPSSVSNATNLSFNLLIILTFLTENRKPKTENGIRARCQ